MKYAMIAGALMLGALRWHAIDPGALPDAGNLYVFGATLFCAGFVGMLTRAIR